MESKKAGPIPLSPESEECLKYYLEVPLHHQMLVSRRPGGAPAAVHQEMPDEVAFLFGHTHKPFQTTRRYAGYGRPVTLHNTGGWVVETTQAQDAMGAAMVLADDDLNTAQVEFYCEARAGAGPASVVTGPAGPNPLVGRLLGLVNPAKNPWAAFTAAVAEDLSNRRQILQTQQTPPPPPPPH